MKVNIFSQILLHLEKKDLISEDFPATEDEFMEKLYSNTVERKRILSVLISLFSEDYRYYLQTRNSLDFDLVKKMAVLGLADEKQLLQFVLGKCSESEQQAVYEKLFKALNFSLTAQENDKDNCFKSLITEVLPEQGTELISKKVKKYNTVHFDLKQANSIFESVQNTLEGASKLLECLDQKKHSTLQPQSQKLETREDEESKFLELSSAMDSFKLQMVEKHISMKPAEASPIPAGFGSAVTELHSHFQFAANCIRSSTSEKCHLKEKTDLENLYTQARQLELNSIVNKIL